MGSLIINATCIGEKPDGIAVYCREIVQGILNENQNRHYIVYINRKGINEMSFLTQRKNVTLYIIPGWFSPDHGFIGHLLRLLFSQYLALRFPKTIIFNPSQLEACFYNKNQVLMVHDLIPMLFHNDPLLRHAKQYYFFKYILGTAIRNAGAVISPSFHTLEMINKRFCPNPGKLFTIHNGIKTPETKPINDTKRKENFILYLGRLSPAKNLAGLINAYRKIADQVPQKLVIAGAGDINLLKEQDSGGDGEIEFLGFVTDDKANELLCNASLFAFPSFYEGFGFPPLEAMARGCPVIVSNTASLPEVCGKAAIYADPYDINSISKAILRVLQDKDLQSRLIKAGYKRVRKFTWVRTARQHQQVFDFIAEGKK